MISRAIVLRQRDVGADVEAEPAVGPLRPWTCGGGRRRRAGRPGGPPSARGGRRSGAPHARSSPRGRRRRCPRPPDRSSCPRRHRRLSPDRRRSERVKCGCRSRCCCVPKPTRTSFWARKLTSLVAFEQEKKPTASGPLAAIVAAEAGGGAVERLVPRGGPQPAVLADERRRQPVVRRCGCDAEACPTVCRSAHGTGGAERARDRRRSAPPAPRRSRRSRRVGSIRGVMAPKIDPTLGVSSLSPSGAARRGRRRGRACRSARGRAACCPGGSGPSARRGRAARGGCA